MRFKDHKGESVEIRNVWAGNLDEEVSEAEMKGKGGNMVRNNLRRAFPLLTTHCSSTTV